jgi:hypothetical protein
MQSIELQSIRIITKKFQMIKIKKIGKENKSYWPESDIEIKNYS